MKYTGSRRPKKLKEDLKNREDGESVRDLYFILKFKIGLNIKIMVMMIRK